MSQPDPLECAVRTGLVPEPGATQESCDSSSGLQLDHFLQHPRIASIIRRVFSDQRRHERLILPNVVGYLGKAHASRPHQIANISVGGFCMVSNELWTPGTEMPITLQRENWDGEESSQCVTVQAIVVRRAPDEVGFSIVFSAKESNAFTEPLNEGLWISKNAMERFLLSLQEPKPPRPLPVCFPTGRPLPLAERTERLLAIAKSHSLSPASELWYTHTHR